MSTKEPTHTIIKVADIIATTDNPRKVNVKSKSFEALLASVKNDGVKIPVIVRPHPTKKGKWDQRAGARRLEAARQAGLKVMPALVYEDMDDEAAFEITFLENFARQDLTVLEEAQAVATLLERSSGDVKACAAKFDRSERWIRMRANVHGNLSDNWIDEFENPKKETGEYGIGHLAVIARFEKDVQDRILEDVVDIDFTVDELDKACGELLMDMSKATWDGARSFEVSDNKIKRPKCDGCPKRTSYQPLLWDDDQKKGKVDRCLDPACWEDKISLVMDEKIEAAKEKHNGLKLLTTEHGYTENIKLAERHGSLLELSDVNQCKKSDKDAFPCFVVRGKQAGSIVWKKKAGGRASSSGSGKGPKTMATKKAELASKRWGFVLKAVREVIADKKVEDIVHEDKLLAVMALVAHIGSNRYLDNCGWLDFEIAVKKGREALTVTLWGLAVEHLEDMLRWNGPVTQVPNEKIEDAKEIMKLLGLDEAKYWDEACEAIKEPKGWSVVPAVSIVERSAVERAKEKPVKKMEVKKKKVVKKKAAKK